MPKQPQQSKQPETAEQLKEQETQTKTETEIAAATTAAMKEKKPLDISNGSSKNDSTATAIKELTASLTLLYQRTEAMAGLMEQERTAMVTEREEYKTARMAVDVQIEQLQEAIEDIQEAAATLVILTQQLAKM